MMFGIQNKSPPVGKPQPFGTRSKALAYENQSPTLEKPHTWKTSIISMRH
jgi:hypothetical protein